MEWDGVGSYEETKKQKERFIDKQIIFIII